MDDLARLDIAEAADALRSGRFRAVDLVGAVLRRAEETEPRLHAYARLMGEQALDDAALADREIAAGGWRGPLHGIPVGVKDLCFTAGVPTEAGSRAMEGFVPDQDATVVVPIPGRYWRLSCIEPCLLRSHRSKRPASCSFRCVGTDARKVG